MTENTTSRNPDSAFDVGEILIFPALAVVENLTKQKGKVLLERARKIKPGHMALAIGLGAGAWLLGDKVLEWSTKFALEGQNTMQGFTNMLLATTEAMSDPSLTPQERQDLGSFTYVLIPLFLSLAGGSIKLGVEAVRPALR